MRPAGRALVAFWAAVLLVAGGGGVLLQMLGPPKPHPAQAGLRPESMTPKPAAPLVAVARAKAAAPVVVAKAAEAPPATDPTMIAAPDPALLEPAPDFPDASLPRIGADGRRPDAVYASHAGLPATGPRIAILLEGVGLADEVSRAAINALPAAISLAFSPYAEPPQIVALTASARHANHEFLLSLPMEPAGAPQDDEGDHVLAPDLDPDKNQRALEWSLSRLQGYVGVTNASGGLRGERFTGASGFSIVTKALADRGLLYVDAGPAAVPPVGAASATGHGGARWLHADLTLDAEPDAADIEARLSRLEQIAQSQGSALGVAGPLRPVLIERLRVWSLHLAERGITLVPVSALPTAPPPLLSALPTAATPPTPVPTTTPVPGAIPGPPPGPPPGPITPPRNPT